MSVDPSTSALQGSKRSFLPAWSADTYSRYAAPFYDLVTNITGWRKHIGFAALEGLLPGALLDVGCGTGFLVTQARAKGFDAIGLDASYGMLQQDLGLRNALVCGSATKLPFPDAHFDSVIACGSLVHIEEISAAANEMLRVCKPAGLIRVIDHARPLSWEVKTPIATIFSHLSGDILHDYKEIFGHYATLESHETLGRGGYLQRYDFRVGTSS